MSWKTPLSIGLVVGVLALVSAAAPMAASASELTDANGNAIPVEDTVTATSTNFMLKLESGTIKCEHVASYGIVTVNSGGEVLISPDPAGEGESTGCTYNELPITLHPKVTVVWIPNHHVEVCLVLVLSESFVSGESKAVVSYESGTSEFHIEGAVTGELSGVLSGDFALADSSGAIVID